MKNHIKKVVATASLALFSIASHANLIANGDFENGNFSNWSVDMVGGSSVFVATSPEPSIGASLSSDNYAFAGNQTGPSRNIFTQVVVLPTSFSSLVFGFDYSYSTNAGLVAPDPDSLEFNGFSGPGHQQFRVEILSGNAAFNSVAPAEILFSAVKTQTGDPSSQAWTAFSADVGAALGALAGQSVMIRFAQFDNLAPFHAGFDNVFLNAQTNAVSAPSTFGALSLVMMGLYVRNRKARRACVKQ